MRILKALALGASLSCLAASTASAEVQITLGNGRVTLVAKDATVRQILAEWARVGQTKIVNAERIPGGPITLQLTGIPEDEALDILLRSVSGYMAAPRAAAITNVSRYDRILVMPTAPAPRVASAPGGPTFQQPSIIQSTADEEAAPSLVTPAARGPIFQTFSPQQQGPIPASPPAGAGQQAPASGPVPSGSAPVGAPRPGMVVQPPATPGPTPPVQPGL